MIRIMMRIMLRIMMRIILRNMMRIMMRIILRIMMRIMEIMDIMDIINITAWMAMAGAVSALVSFHRLSPLGRVGHRVVISVCLCVCRSVTKIEIVDNCQSVRFFVHKIEWVGMVLRILNLKDIKIARLIQK